MKRFALAGVLLVAISFLPCGIRGALVDKKADAAVRKCHICSSGKTDFCTAGASCRVGKSRMGTYDTTESGKKCVYAILPILTCTTIAPARCVCRSSEGWTETQNYERCGL
jgi:uncharacterized membrane protein